MGRKSSIFVWWSVSYSMNKREVVLRSQQVELLNRDHCAHSGYKLIPKRLLKKTFFIPFPVLERGWRGSKRNRDMKSAVHIFREMFWRYKHNLFYEWKHETNLNIIWFLEVIFLVFSSFFIAVDRWSFCLLCVPCVMSMMFLCLPACDEMNIAPVILIWTRIYFIIQILNRVDQNSRRVKFVIIIKL